MESTTNILFIAYHFPPTGGAGVQRALKFVQHLPSEGFLPVVVAGPGQSTDSWSPRDASLLASIPAEVPVHRVAGPVPQSSGKVKRRMETLLAMPGPFSKWWIESATTVSLNARPKAALVFATMSPFESAEVASRVAGKLGVPWVADLRDSWAIDEVFVYPSYMHRRIEMMRMERVLSSASLIIMNTSAAAEALRKTFGRLSGKKVTVIPNGYDPEDFNDRLQPRVDSKFRIVHSGTTLTSVALDIARHPIYRLLGGVRSDVNLMTRSPVFLVEAIQRWCERRSEAVKDLDVTFAGISSEADDAIFRKTRLSGVFRAVGYLPHEESLRLIRTSDLLFLPMHNLRAGERSLSVPGKTYELIATGRPILAAVPDGDARDVLEKCGTAHLCRPDDVTAMVAILDRVYGAWKEKRPRTTYDPEFVAQFDRRLGTRALAEGFRAVLARSTFQKHDQLARGCDSSAIEIGC